MADETPKEREVRQANPDQERRLPPMRLAGQTAHRQHVAALPKVRPATSRPSVKPQGMYYGVPKPRQRKPKPIRAALPDAVLAKLMLTKIRYIGEHGMHTTFIDGPAAGQKLSLRRNPLLLRVTHDPVTNSTVGGVWDALDQPNDKLGRSEKVYLYRLTGPPGYVHIRASRGSGLGGSWCTGVYELLKEQPARDILRDNALFGRWCDKNRIELMPAWATALLNTPEGPENA